MVLKCLHSRKIQRLGSCTIIFTGNLFTSKGVTEFGNHRLQRRKTPTFPYILLSVYDMQFWNFKTPNKYGLFIPFTNQQTVKDNFLKEYTFYKSNYPFLFCLHCTENLHHTFTKFFFHKNILLYKSVCINIRGVASCRRNIV